MPHVFETVTVSAATLGASLPTPVVLLHASLSCKSQWDPLIEKLGTRFEPVALDLVGYGPHALPPPAPSFTIDDEVRHMVNQKASTVELRKRAREMGMRTLREDGIRKVLAGLTTAEEVISTTMSDAD